MWEGRKKGNKHVLIDTDSLSSLDFPRSLSSEDTNLELGLSGERLLSVKVKRFSRQSKK
jgi:hypothetical protein